MRAFCCLAALTTFATAAQAEATKYPLTLDNCGVEVTFDKAPATTVSLGQTATEILYSLDLADKVAGHLRASGVEAEVFAKVKPNLFFCFDDGKQRHTNGNNQ